VAYTTHPYKWATIGKEISHIENATMEDVQAFFNKFYDPSNAILVLAGDITEEKALELTNKWFGSIPSKGKVAQEIPMEPVQNEARFLEIKSDVPAAAIHKAYHMPARMGKDYHAADLFSDILGRGKSSYLHERLVNDLQWMSSVSSYVSGSYDPGLLTISGKLNDGIAIEDVDKEIQNIVNKLLSSDIKEHDLQKIKNQAEATMIFGETELLNRAMGLAYASFLGNTNLVNDELAIVQSITTKDILEAGKSIMKPNNCTTVYYLPEN
jgi:zinc protease